MERDIQKTIDELVKSNEIVIFMKGTPAFPMCGFSQQTAAILGTLERPFKAVDVIGEPEYRQAIKEYSKWPTLPQVFVGGELVGGCDIVRDMYDSGQLQTVVDGAFAGGA